MAFLMRALLGMRQETQKTGISSGSGTGRSPPVVSSPSYPSEIKIKWSLNKSNPAEFILSETESWLEKGVSLHEGFKDEGFKKKNRSVWTSLSLAEVFRPLVAYAADDDSSSSSAGVKNTRGWERPGVPPIRPAPPKPKPLLSLDSNIVIEAGRGKLEVSHPKLKALLDRHQLVVSDRLVPEIKDEGARSSLSPFRRRNPGFLTFSLGLNSLFGKRGAIKPEIFDDVTEFATAHIDWLETDEAHVLKSNVPGLNKEEINVKIEAGCNLRISAELKKWEPEKVTDNFLRMERAVGPLHRRIRLPDNANTDEATASLVNGVLTITIPKRAKFTPPDRVIEVK